MVVANKAWYQYPEPVQVSYGKITDPLGPYLKPDVNFNVPNGTIITALRSGTVSNVSDLGKSSGGLSVVVALDVPLNQLATHVAYNYLGSATAKTGQHVNVGDQIGISGSRYGIPVALGLTSDPGWGGGTFYLNAQANPLLDPHIILSGQQPGGFTGGTASSTFISVSNNVHSILNNVPGFQGIAEGLDAAESFVPFIMVNSGGQAIGILGHLPFIGPALQDAAGEVTLPSDMIQALLTFITANALAALIRTVIIYIGISIIITLIRNAVIGGVTDIIEDPKTKAVLSVAKAIV